ncbi:TauD/TfdA family dioxygenase [Nocardia niwae]|uniref:TauD/TfdA family dioxygenase n=1 Tax=Nocardia niwae TaxID=626084 RepID=UPI0033F2AE53
MCSAAAVAASATRHSHRWAVGDLVIWDNRATMHTAPPCDHPRHQPAAARRSGCSPNAALITAAGGGRWLERRRLIGAAARSARRHRRARARRGPSTEYRLNPSATQIFDLDDRVSVIHRVG